MLSAQTYFTRVIFLIVLGSPALSCQTLHAQDASPGASQPPPIVFSKVVLLPTITEREDFFGRRIYSGTVAVEGSKRLDFITVRLTLRDSTGAVLLEEDSYIFGTRHVFQDGTVSTSSLNAGHRGTFTFPTGIPVSAINSWDIAVNWKEFDILPENTQTFHGGTDWKAPDKSRRR